MTLQEKWPNLYQRLVEIAIRLENYYCDMCDIEFTIENNNLYILSSRIAKRTSKANLRVNLDFFHEGKITLSEMLARIKPIDVTAILKQQIKNKDALEILGRGLSASVGAGTGKIVLSSKKAMLLDQNREKFIFVKTEVQPEDVPFMFASQGVLTSRGGMTSHAAVVCRGMEKPCVSGFGQMNIDYKRRTITVPNYSILKEGDWITIDGSDGTVYAGTGHIKKEDWHSYPELLLLSKLIDIAVITKDVEQKATGNLWRIRDYFYHRYPLSKQLTREKPISRKEYSSFTPPIRGCRFLFRKRRIYM